MEFIILIITILTLVETSFLLFKKIRPVRSSVRKIYVDSSVLIDGRIISIAKTGFLSGDLIILKSVLLELQLLADSKESERRALGRTGLDNASELERILNVNTEIVDDASGLKKVDEELLKIAKETKGAILTIDYNLIKVAEAEKIPTLNINDLALSVREEYTPGEKFKIKIAEKGTGRDQGIGHLSNGTMVVVSGAAKKIGQEVTVQFLKFLETSAGRIVFAKLAKK